MGGGGPDENASIVDDDVAQPGHALDVDQVSRPQESFLHEQQQFGAAGIERRLAAVYGLVR